jgi:hypothetical protein
MAIPIVDFLIWLKITSIWVSGKVRRLVFRLGSGKVKRRIVVLVGFNVFMKVLEHSDLGGVSVMFVRVGGRKDTLMPCIVSPLFVLPMTEEPHFGQDFGFSIRISFS